MAADLPLIIPDWPAPTRVRAVSTTRNGGVSTGPYSSFNLGDHVKDDAHAVAANRRHLVQSLQLPVMPGWLRQVHGSVVADLRSATMNAEADAAWSDNSDRVCAILTADCLPVLLCDQDATVVAAVHAGWRGLAGGVIAACVRALPVAPETLMAWMGPAISQASFEVGAEVRDVFIKADTRNAAAFVPAQGQGKYLADLYAIARLQLQTLGLQSIHGGDFCTYSDAKRFFSYRRDGECGRMASLIWLQN